MKKVVVLALVLFVVLGLDCRLKTVVYEIESGEIARPVRFAVIADLHCCDYGQDSRQLLEAVARGAPDGVLLTGDILDDSMPLERGCAALKELAARWPCYYVTGNHDAYLAEEVAACGVTVLQGDYLDITVKDQPIRICGVADPRAEGWEVFGGRLDSLAQANSGHEGFTLLLAHRPDRIGQYLPGGYDLIVSGHAHGGQWRIPGLLNGVIAPGQGLFPQYAGGRYDLEGTVFLVSRGLARESTRVPRFYNRPELLFVDVK